MVTAVAEKTDSELAQLRDFWGQLAQLGRYFHVPLETWSIDGVPVEEDSMQVLTDLGFSVSRKVVGHGENYLYKVVAPLGSTIEFGWSGVKVWTNKFVLTTHWCPRKQAFGLYVQTPHAHDIAAD